MNLNREDERISEALKSSEERILEGLNEQQREAVLHGEGPLLIIAGAGTGKTLVTTHRIAHLIASKRARPEEILALTFTEKAAAEMEERVDLLVPYGYMEVWISTFHAFGDRILKEEALELGLSSDLQVLTEPEQIIFFREHLFEFPLSYYRPLGNPTRYIEAMVNLFNRAKDEDVGPDEYLAWARTLEATAGEDPELKAYASRQVEIALCYQKYQELIAKNGRIDFGDQVSYVLKLFREHPEVLKKYRQRFRYILVDEFQDTNYSQFQLVKLLAGPDGNITVVGDDDQSIYKFRGAAISNILGFMEQYPRAKQIVLTRNYRSHQVLLDTAYRLIRYNNPERLEIKNNIDKRLIARKDGGTPVKLLYYDTLSSEADGVAKLINEKVKAGTHTYRDFAILVRSNNDADSFLRSLNMRGIPWRFTGNQGLYDREEIRLLMAFLRVIADFQDSVSLYYLASSEIYRFNPIDLVRCMNVANGKNKSLYDTFINLEDTPELERISPSSRETISRVLADIERYVTSSVKKPTGELLYDFIMDTGYLQNLTSHPSRENEEKVRNIARFFEVVRNVGKLIDPDRVPRFVSYLDMLVEAGDNPPVAEADEDTDAVNVLTVHKAKGLEFKVVFMVGLVSGRFPWPHRRDRIELPDELIKEKLPTGDFHIQEERRLFYVGMTRAKEELYFTSARDYGGKRARKPSQFILEALGLPKADLPVYKSSPLEAIRRSASRTTPSPTEYSPIADDEIITLSYYQIDDYLTCPLKYKYVHLLRVPIIQHHSVIYGKALHDAVQEYHRRKVANKGMTLEELISVFENSWVSEGFLTREHEEQRFQAGKEALRRFYYEQEADPNLPTFVEKDFSFMVENNRIVGRWDRVDDRDGEVVIIDFKSSEIRQQDDADRRARDSLQLSIYALAYLETFGKLPDRAELHFLESGLVGATKKRHGDMEKIRDRIREAARGIRARDFKPDPDYLACEYCAYSGICSRNVRRG